MKNAYVDLQSTSSATSLKTGLNLWISDCLARGLRPRTIGFYREYVRMFIEFFGADMPIEKLTSQAVTSIMANKRNAGLSGRSIHHVYRVARTFSSWLYNQELTDTDLLARMRAPRTEKTLRPPMSMDMITAILHTAKGDSLVNLRNTALYMILLDTAARSSEVLAMTRDSVASDRVLLTNCKSRSDRFVYLSPATRIAIIKYLKARTDTFPNLWVTDDQTPLTTGGLQQILKRATAKAGIHASFHDFRRTSATALVEHGTNLEIVRQLLGHSDVSTTQRYLRVSTAVIQEAHLSASIINHLPKGHGIAR